jgi:hypothetical protein
LHAGGVGADNEGDDDGTRRSKRRRWRSLAHWKGERIQYTETGAVNAVREGVLTPDLISYGKVCDAVRAWGHDLSVMRCGRGG